MEITEFKENEDGTATLTADISNEEISMLIDYAVNNILRKEMKNIKKDQDE